MRTPNYTLFITLSIIAKLHRIIYSIFWTFHFIWNTLTFLHKQERNIVCQFNQATTWNNFNNVWSWFAEIKIRGDTSGAGAGNGAQACQWFQQHSLHLADLACWQTQNSLLNTKKLKKGIQKRGELVPEHGSPDPIGSKNVLKSCFTVLLKPTLLKKQWIRKWALNH